MILDYRLNTVETPALGGPPLPSLASAKFRGRVASVCTTGFVILPLDSEGMAVNGLRFSTEETKVGDVMEDKNGKPFRVCRRTERVQQDESISYVEFEFVEISEEEARAQ